jgi:hypothetical protein
VNGVILLVVGIIGLVISGILAFHNIMSAESRDFKFTFRRHVLIMILSMISGAVAVIGLLWIGVDVYNSWHH